jgi:hypothetical protein
MVKKVREGQGGSGTGREKGRECQGDAERVRRVREGQRGREGRRSREEHRGCRQGAGRAERSGQRGYRRSSSLIDGPPVIR